jgi:hypothetical protein
MSQTDSKQVSFIQNCFIANLCEYSNCWYTSNKNSLVGGVPFVGAERQTAQRSERSKVGMFF